ncbi:retrovirus-related pol polyprotein from transposon TNT 1-94 [Tanacetum coccineum]
MSNSNTNLQTQSSNALHNAIIEAGSKDRLPILAWVITLKPVQINSYMGDSDITPQLMLVQNACRNVKKAIDKVDDNMFLLQLQPDWQRMRNDVQYDKNEKILHVLLILLHLLLNSNSLPSSIPFPTQNTQYSSTRSQQSTRNRKKRRNCYLSAPTYDLEPATVTEKMRKCQEKEDWSKLMALISLSFKKIYKPTNNNLRTSSNTSRANQDNSPRINRGTGYDNQRAVNVAGARENVGTLVVQKSGIQCYNCKEYGHVSRESDWKDDTDDESEEQELEAHYMYMAQLQEVTPDPVDNSGPIFDDEPMHKVQNNNDNYNVFAMENEHPEQPKSSNDIYLTEQGDSNITIDSLDICYDRAQDDQDEKLDDFFFANLEFIKVKIKRTPRVMIWLDATYDNLALMLAPDSDETDSSEKIIVCLSNNSQGKKQEVEDHCRKFKFSNNKTSVTACNDSLNAKTSNVNFVCVTCGKCVLNDNHDLCVLHYINGVNSRTRQPMVVPISTREPKHNVNQSVATFSKKTVATDSTVLVEIILFIVDSGCSKHMTGNLKLLTNFVEDNFLERSSLEMINMHQFLAMGDLGNDLLTGSRRTDLYSIFSANDLNNSQSNLLYIGLHALVITVRTDKGTEFLNKTLHAYFAKERIRYETSTARTPEQNSVVERQNRTLVEAARTMLSAAKVPLFFWDKAIATTCFTQNRSLIIPRHEKTPYHIINARKPSVKFFHIFGSLCYIVRDGENLDKIKEKGDACIFLGYSTQSKAYRVFNKKTRMIVETIHVNFDVLPQMASDHVSSDPVTTSNELELLYSPMFSKLLNGNYPVVSKSSAVHAADNPDKHQQHNTTHTSTTTDVADPPPLNIHSTHQLQLKLTMSLQPENIIQARRRNNKYRKCIFDDDKFINIFSTQSSYKGRHVSSC